MELRVLGTAVAAAVFTGRVREQWQGTAAGAVLSVCEAATVTSGSFHEVGQVAAKACAVKGRPACGRSHRDP
jgi:hypothetical protein